MGLQSWMQFWLPCLAYWVYPLHALLWDGSHLIRAVLSWSRGTWHREEREGDRKVCVTSCCSMHGVPKCLHPLWHLR